MKPFKVNKNMNKEPYIFGLKIPLFFGFMGVVVFVVFSFVSGLSWAKLIFSVALLIVSHTVLKRMNSGSLFARMIKERFPDTIINDNYR